MGVATDTGWGRDLHYRMSFQPVWDGIDHIRQSIGSCLSAVFEDADLCAAVSMVCSLSMKRRIAASPVTASMRRTPEAIPLS